MKRKFFLYGIFVLLLFLVTSLTYGDVRGLPKRTYRYAGIVESVTDRYIEVSNQINDNVKEARVFKIDNDTVITGVILRGKVATIIYIIKRIDQHMTGHTTIRLAKEIRIIEKQ